MATDNHAWEGPTLFEQTCGACHLRRNVRPGKRGGWVVVLRWPDGREQRTNKVPPCVAASVSKVEG